MARDNHHDSLFRSSFTRKEVAVAYLQSQLPSHIVAKCDWSGLRIKPGSYVDPSLQSIESDILYEIPLRGGGGSLLVYVLLEHQHRVELVMGFRLLRYMVRIWDRWLQEQEGAAGKGLPLPAIVPLVLYHGERKWTAKTSFQDLFSAEMRSLLGGHLPSFQYEVHDLARLPDAQIQGDALGKMTLLLLKHGRGSAFWELFPAWASLLAAVLAHPRQGRDAFFALLRYIVLVGQQKPPDHILALLVQVGTPDTPEVIMGWAQQLHDEGLLKGRQEGRQEGRGEGQRELLARLLERRFGPLSAADQQRLTDASQEALLTWGERLFGAQSLEDVFTDK